MIDYGQFIRTTAPSSPVAGKTFWFDANSPPGALYGWSGSWSLLSNSGVFVSNSTFVGFVANSGFNLTVREVDSGPTVSSVTQIIVSNGTLTNNGSGSVTIVTGSSSGGGGLSLVEHKLFTSDTSSYVFSALDGNTDGNYLLIVDLINKHSPSAQASYSLKWNDATTNFQSHLRWFSFAGGDTTGSLGSTTCWLGFAVVSGSVCHAEIKISARKNPNAVNRPLHYSGTGNQVGGGTYTWVTGGYHQEFTNLTSFVISSDVSDGIGDGSEAVLWRLVQS